MEHKKEDGHQPHKGRQGAAALTNSHNHCAFFSQQTQYSIISESESICQQLPTPIIYHKEGETYGFGFTSLLGTQYTAKTTFLVFFLTVLLITTRDGDQKSINLLMIHFTDAAANTVFYYE